ncbi:MAG TPA: hypothetical protein PKO18_02290 [Chitinophagales bacterium]|nr:hypothetical protein [Chitinophagales bacterium]HNL84036.1 hypothetical protein [Chitinophagales bacterium]
MRKNLLYIFLTFFYTTSLFAGSNNDVGNEKKNIVLNDKSFSIEENIRVNPDDQTVTKIIYGVGGHSRI